MYMDIFQLTYISLCLLTTFSDLNQQKKKKNVQRVQLLDVN